MAKPLPLPVFHRRTGTVSEEFLDDHPTKSEPQKSLTQWLESCHACNLEIAASQIPGGGSPTFGRGRKGPKPRQRSMRAARCLLPLSVERARTVLGIGQRNRFRHAC